MKQRMAFGLPLLILGILLIVTPLYIFPGCEIAEGMKPMKCHWTGKVMSGFGALFLFAGVLLAFSKNVGVSMGISMMVVCAAMVAGTIPTFLIGMCMVPTMPCRTGTYPAVMILLALTALAGITNSLYFNRRLRKVCHESSHDAASGAEQS